MLEILLAVAATGALVYYFMKDKDVEKKKEKTYPVTAVKIPPNPNEKTEEAVYYDAPDNNKPQKNKFPVTAVQVPHSILVNKPATNEGPTTHPSSIHEVLKMHPKKKK